MTTHTKASATRDPDAAKMRAIARDRSRARARIAQRGAQQQRALFGGIVLVLAAVVLWILVAGAAVSAGFAIGATALGGAYLLGFGYLVSTWSSLNDADEARIAKANKALRGATSVRGPRGVRQPVADAKPTQEVQGSAMMTSADGVEVSNPTPEKSAAQSTATAPAPKLIARESVARLRPQIEAPSYTLKPTRKTVKPYEAPEVPTAEVPFRPTRLGERIGDAPLEAANPAPEMSGGEELRSDVLGGGSTLDALLDRRRA